MTRTTKTITKIITLTNEKMRKINIMLTELTIKRKRHIVDKPRKL